MGKEIEKIMQYFRFLQWGAVYLSWEHSDIGLCEGKFCRFLYMCSRKCTKSWIYLHVILRMIQMTGNQWPVKQWRPSSLLSNE